MYEELQIDKTEVSSEEILTIESLQKIFKGKGILIIPQQMDHR